MLFLGDSSIAGVGASTQGEALSGRVMHHLAPQQEPISWRVLGTTGWTTEDALEALNSLPDQRYDIVVISLGVNDVTTENSLEDWLETYDTILNTLSERFGMRLTIVSGLPPMGRFPALPQPLRWYLGLRASANESALFQRYQTRPDTICLPLIFDLDPSAMAEDGFHPGPPVYDAWATRVADAIAPRLKDLVETP
ncbi:MAG: SGNH/GDSL hydrolase family protein [Pseudomonadota bacterium]